MDWRYWDALAGGIDDVPIFAEVGAAARQAKVLTREQLIRICHWKSPYPKPVRRLICYLNEHGCQEREQPVDFTRCALAAARAGNEEKDLEAVRILTQELAQDPRNGIGVPIASAILTVVYPKRYAIIDRYSMKGLAYVKPVYKSVNQPTVDHYVKKFLPRIRDIVEERSRIDKCEWTPRRVEKALWTWGGWQQWKNNVAAYL